MEEGHQAFGPIPRGVGSDGGILRNGPFLGMTQE